MRASAKDIVEKARKHGVNEALRTKHEGVVAAAAAALEKVRQDPAAAAAAAAAAETSESEAEGDVSPDGGVSGGGKRGHSASHVANLRYWRATGLAHSWPLTHAAGSIDNLMPMQLVGNVEGAVQTAPALPSTTGTAEATSTATSTDGLNTVVISESDEPWMAQEGSATLQRGDVVVVMSDGIGDNLRKNQVRCSDVDPHAHTPVLLSPTLWSPESAPISSRDPSSHLFFTFPPLQLYPCAACGSTNAGIRGRGLHGRRSRAVLIPPRALPTLPDLHWSPRRSGAAADGGRGGVGGRVGEQPDGRLPRANLPARAQDRRHVRGRGHRVLDPIQHTPPRLSGMIVVRTDR